MSFVTTLTELINTFFVNQEKKYEYCLVMRDYDEDPGDNPQQLRTLSVKRGDVVTISKHCGRIYTECSFKNSGRSLIHTNLLLSGLKFCVSNKNSSVQDLAVDTDLTWKIGEIFVILEEGVGEINNQVRCMNQQLIEGLIPANNVRMSIDRCMLINSISPAPGEKIKGHPILKGEKNEIVIIIEEVGDRFLKCVNRFGEYGLVSRENVKIANKIQRKKNRELSRKIIRLKYPHFIKLPFRLVLSHIFPFIFPNINSSEERKKSRDVNNTNESFEYFGYFSLDPQRTRFFLFPNITMNSGCKALIDYTRLKTLAMRNITPKQMKQIIMASPYMSRLENLILSCCMDEGDIGKDFENTKYGDLFSNPKLCFPNLKELKFLISCYINDYEVDFDITKWEEEHVNHIWENLRVFRFSVPSLRGNNNAIVRILNRMVNLETLDLSGRDFPPNTVLNNLKSLKTLGISGLMEKTTRIESYDTLQSITSFQCHSDLVKDLVMGSRCGMRYVDISNCRPNEQASYDWLVKEHRASSFEEVHLSNLNFQPSSFKNFSEKLEVLYLSRCPGFKTHHFSTIIYPRLKKLTMYHLSSFEIVDVKFPSSKSVEWLTLDMSKLNESIFTINEWSALKNLIMFDVESVMTGENWKAMENLRVIQLLRMKNFQNSVFEKRNIFPNLERLSLHNMNKITGVNWDPCFMRNLKKLEILCMKFDSSVFFEENVFPRLEHLCLRFFMFKNQDKEGVFQATRNLKTFEISVSNITDKIFELSKCFDNLVVLEIDECENIKGENWAFLKSLLEFKAGKGVFLGLDFLKFPPFGEHVNFKMKEKSGDDFF